MSGCDGGCDEGDWVNTPGEEYGPGHCGARGCNTNEDSVSRSLVGGYRDQWISSGSTEWKELSEICIQKYIHFIICGMWALGRIFGRHQNASFCYQKDRTRSRSVSVHLDLTYDASRAHRRGCGDKPKK